jgi:hypothetical protein
LSSLLAAAAGSRLPLLNYTAHHQNSRFRLFVQMSYANSALWQLGTVLLCRIVFRRLVPMQLTLALLVVSWAPGGVVLHWAAVTQRSCQGGVQLLR